MLRAIPHSAAARRVTISRLEKVLREAGRVQRVTQTAQTLHTALRAPHLRQSAAVEQAMAIRLAILLEQATHLHTTSQHLITQITEVLDQHPHGRIYRSFPGIGPVLAGRLLAEIGDDTARFARSRDLRSYAGATPLTWASGTSTRTMHRRAANRDLKVACHQWAYSALAAPGPRAHADRRRAAGDRHATALRHLSARLLACLHHCLANDARYDSAVAFPATAGGEPVHAAPTGPGPQPHAQACETTGR